MFRKHGQIVHLVGAVVALTVSQVNLIEEQRGGAPLHLFHYYQKTLSMINEKTQCLNLVVTEKCNLNCVYCQSNKSFSGALNFEVAKLAIDEFLGCSKAEAPAIAFMGGEPFLAFPTIKRIVEYINDTYPEKRTQYSIVTNGTLVHGEIQQWIVEHSKSVQVVLSLDSLGDEHNINRCGSLNKIDIDFFLSLPKPIINTVLTPTSINSLSSTILSLHQKGFFIKSYLADGESWTSESIEILDKELSILIDYYLSHPEMFPMSMLNQSLYLLFEKDIIKCGTNEYYQVSISADGKQYACHRCTPYENHGSWKIPDQYLGLLNACYLNDECKHCFVRNICNTCPASNAALKEQRALASVVCQIRRLLLRANAYMYIMMLTKQSDYAALRHLSNQHKIQTLQAARKILEEIHINPLF